MKTFKVGDIVRWHRCVFSPSWHAIFNHARPTDRGIVVKARHAIYDILWGREILNDKIPLSQDWLTLVKPKQQHAKK